MMTREDSDKLRSLIDHYGLHDVLVEAAVAVHETADRLRIVDKQNPRAKLYEYMSELLVHLTDDHAVQSTKAGAR